MWYNIVLNGRMIQINRSIYEINHSSDLIDIMNFSSPSTPGSTIESQINRFFLILVVRKLGNLHVLIAFWVLCTFPQTFLLRLKYLWVNFRGIQALWLFKRRPHNRAVRYEGCCVPLSLRNFCWSCNMMWMLEITI